MAIAVQFATLAHGYSRSTRYARSWL